MNDFSNCPDLVEGDGQLFTVEEFHSKVQSSEIDLSNGRGFYATEVKLTALEIPVVNFLSPNFEKKILKFLPSGVTHILWRENREG